MSAGGPVLSAPTSAKEPSHAPVHPARGEHQHGERRVPRASRPARRDAAAPPDAVAGGRGGGAAASRRAGREARG
ncbi:hypothetical protein CLM84_32780, partial [Streptomyces albidoflavus]